MEELRAIVHEALCLGQSPLVKHQQGGQYVRVPGLALIKSGRGGPSFNFAAALEVPLLSLSEILPHAEAVFGTDRSSYGILVEGDRAEPLESKLKQAGYEVFEDEPAFARPRLDDIIVPKHPMTIEVVRTPSEHRATGAFFSAVFNSPPELMEELTPISTLGDPEIQLYLGRLGDEIVTGVGCFGFGKTVHVAGTATLESHRRRGLGAAIVLHALAEWHRRGYTSAALRSGLLSIPLYERLGFVYVCQHRTYFLKAS